MKDCSDRLARRVERKVSGSQRRARALNFILCAVVLVLGIMFLMAVVRGWFIVL